MKELEDKLEAVSFQVVHLNPPSHLGRFYVLTYGSHREVLCQKFNQSNPPAFYSDTIEGCLQKLVEGLDL